MNLNVTLGIDGISLFFLLLTTLLILLCILISWNSIQFNLKGYLISFLSIAFFLIGVFCLLDIKNHSEFVLIFYSVFSIWLLFFAIISNHDDTFNSQNFFFNPLEVIIFFVIAFLLVFTFEEPISVRCANDGNELLNLNREEQNSSDGLISAMREEDRLETNENQSEDPRVIISN